MATIILCDACGAQGASNKFLYRAHLTEKTTFYCDSAGNHISDKIEYIDLCNKCYNEVLQPAIKVLKALQDNRYASTGIIDCAKESACQS